MYKIDVNEFWYLGQDEYSMFPTQYSVDIDGYVLVYSIDSEQSFEVVQVKIIIIIIIY